MKSHPAKPRGPKPKLGTWESLMQAGLRMRFFEDRIAEAQEPGAIRNRLPAALLDRSVLNGWEGALLRMRAEKSDAEERATRSYGVT